MNWIAENWHVFWGIGGAILILGLHSYARRHPETEFASHWERLHYTAMAGAVFSVISMLLNGILQGFFGIHLFTIDATPYVSAGLFVVAWFAAPCLRRVLRSGRGEA